MKRIILLVVLFVCLISAKTLEFDAQNAFQYLEEQVNMGPRYPGSPGQILCRDWLIENSNLTADTVIIQAFDAFRPDTRTTVRAYNIIARFSPEKENRVMLSAHWDTRPISDMDMLNYKTPVPGANDGASGTAVLLEIMNNIPKMNIDVGVDVIFWDAEDMGVAHTGKYFCQGSEYYANNTIAPKPKRGILIDMIGDADLTLPVESNSMIYAPALVMEVWDIAAQLGYGNIFRRVQGPEIHDDHIPLNLVAKIPTIDIIDFDYRYNNKNIWHTPKDLPAYCSPQSLKYVGDVLLEWLMKQ